MNVGIVGLGSIVEEYHVPVLHALGHKVIWAADPAPSRQTWIKDYFPSVTTASTANEFLRIHQVDAVLVASPTALHAEQTKQCLSAGVHVLCEKPLACTHEDARTLASTAASHSRVLQVGYYRRHFPALRQLGKFIADESFGAVRHIHLRGGHIAKRIPASFLDPRLAGGGVLLDFGVHIFDLLLTWGSAVEITRYEDDAGRGGVEANARIQLNLRRAQGIAIETVVELSRTQPLGYSATVEFEESTVTADLNSGSELKLTPRRHNGDPIIIQSGPTVATTDYFAAEWREFALRLGGAEEQIHSLESAVTTSGLAEMCYLRRNTLVLSWGN